MHQHHRARYRRLRTRIGIAAVVAAASFGVLAVAAPGVDAAPPTATSRVRVADPIVAVAVAALDDLRSYVASGASDTAAFTDYQSARDQIAAELASRIDIDPTALSLAWQEADIPHQMALMAAFTQLGVPYRRNTSKPGEGFDCSGLTTYAWGVAGTTLTRQSGAQIRNAASRTATTAMAGDLVYFPGHAMMWLGVGQAIVHAPSTGKTVEVDVIAARRGVRFGNPIG